MNRVYAAFGVLFLIGAPIRFVYVTLRDLAHPEVWDQDFTRDPRIYLPLVAAELLAGAVLLWRVSRRKATTAGAKPAAVNTRRSTAPPQPEVTRCRS